MKSRGYTSFEKFGLASASLRFDTHIFFAGEFKYCSSKSTAQTSKPAANKGRLCLSAPGSKVEDRLDVFSSEEGDYFRNCQVGTEGGIDRHGDIDYYRLSPFCCQVIVRFGPSWHRALKPQRIKFCTCRQERTSDSFTRGGRTSHRAQTGNSNAFKAGTRRMSDQAQRTSLYLRHSIPTPGNCKSEGKSRKESRRCLSICSAEIS